MKICCISGKAEHGKTTFANFVKEECENTGLKVVIIHYGDILKWLADKIYGCGFEKNDTTRTIWQQFGTNVVREKVGDWYWVTLVNIFAKAAEAAGVDVLLIPDARFPNEIDYMREHNSDVEAIRVLRSGHKSRLDEVQLQHPSETALDDYEQFDLWVMNDSDLQNLKDSAKTFVSHEILKKQSLPEA